MLLFGVRSIMWPPKKAHIILSVSGIGLGIRVRAAGLSKEATIRGARSKRTIRLILGL